MLHALGLQGQHARQRGGLGRKVLRVVGQVEKGVAIAAGRDLLELGAQVDGLALRVERAAEGHVLQQVRHARLARALHAAAHLVGHGHEGPARARHGHQEQLQAVVELVFADAGQGAQRLQFLRRRRQADQAGSEPGLEGLEHLVGLPVKRARSCLRPAARPPAFAPDAAGWPAPR